MDVGSIKVARVTCDRFLRNVHEIAIAEDLIPVFSGLLAMAFETTSTSATISALESKKRKAQERVDDVNVGFTNETLI